MLGSLVNVDDFAMELEIAQISDSIIELMVMFSAQIQLLVNPGRSTLCYWEETNYCVGRHVLFICVFSLCNLMNYSVIFTEP